MMCKRAMFAAAVLSADAACAVNDTPETRAEDKPKVNLTCEQIAALPRRKAPKVAMPSDAQGRIYIGSGVYRHGGCRMKSGGFCFTRWDVDKLSLDEIVDLCDREQVGNTLQFWLDAKDILRLGAQAKRRGIYSTSIYSSGEAADVARLAPELGEHWLGYDFGERYNFSIYQKWDGRGASLRDLAAEYMGRVRRHVTARQAAGWGNIQATSANFSLDYEVAAGAEVPVTEDFPFGDLTLASALSRGLYRQYDLPMWGAHLAHEWYSWIPHRNPYKMKTLETAFYLKYMTGAKLIVNESGNWELQSSLCEDSPMSRLPVTAQKISTKLDAAGRAQYEAPVIDEARRKSAFIDYRSPVAVKYRKIISDFYAFCKTHPAPRGQPEAAWALAKGNLDLGDCKYVPGAAVCGAYDLAQRNPNWMAGLPEMSWETVRKAVMPMPPMLAPNKNIHFSGSPYGLCDVVSFACDNVSAPFLLRNYRVLMFSGWNTCSQKQYRILCDYVKGGGVLVIGLCHLSTDDARNYTSPSVETLVNRGDFTELCGFKVRGQTPRRYWATGPATTPNALGFVARRRFGYMCQPLGALEYVAPKDHFEVLAVDDEEADPFIVRCRNGKGQVLFMNWWAYPAAANMDVGCGAETKDVGMVGYLYRYAAKLARGNVYITGGDFENPDEDCAWILYSYFPDEGKVYLLNLDYARERRCVLQQFGDKDFVTLKPAEFRIVSSVKLDRGDKLNEE